MICLASTNGRLPFLSQALMEELDAKFPGEISMSVNLGDAMQPTSLAALSAHVDAGGKDLTSLFASGVDRIVFATPWDAAMQLPDSDSWKGADEVILTVDKFNLRVSLENIVIACRNLIKPEWLVIPHEVIGPGYSRKHRDRAFKRATQWMSSMASHKLAPKLLFPIIEDSPEGAVRCFNQILEISKAASLKSSDFGFCLSSIAAVSPRARLRIVQAIKNMMAAEGFDGMMVFAPLGSLPLDGILDAVVEGVECFETTLPFTMTKLAYAFCFSLDNVFESISINLRDSCFKINNEPLARGCKCFTCRNHTKGYLHHLIDAKEILGDMLLFHHNTHMIVQLIHNLKASEHKAEFVRKWKVTHRIAVLKFQT